MDRLFRAEIEAEEEQRAVEMAVDVTPFLGSAIEPEPDPLIEPAMDGGIAARLGKGLWIGVAAAVVVAVASTIFIVTRGPETPPPPPTPTAADMAAQRQAQDQKIRALAEGLVSEMMAEKEQEIREELLDRQTKIEELQKRLQASERRARQGQLSSDEQRRREELQRQIAAEEEAQRQRETELEAERQRAAEEVRQQAAAQQTAAEEEAQLAASLTATVPAPTEAPTPRATVITSPEATIEENSFVDPSETDSLPVVIKDAPVVWPQAALRSRRNGVVIVQATVDATGKVVAVKVLRADHDGFGIPEAVLDAARNYRFKPGTKDGVPITTYATVTKVYRFVVR
jgi:TonB family protein